MLCPEAAPEQVEGCSGEPGAKACVSSHRDTMLQALRFVIQGAGSKVDAAIRKSLVSLLLSMLGHDEVRRGPVAALQSPLLFVFACFLHVVRVTGWGRPGLTMLWP